MFRYRQSSLWSLRSNSGMCFLMYWALISPCQQAGGSLVVFRVSFQESTLIGRYRKQNVPKSVYISHWKVRRIAESTSFIFNVVVRSAMFHGKAVLCLWTIKEHVYVYSHSHAPPLSLSLSLSLSQSYRFIHKWQNNTDEKKNSHSVRY